jgi:hypothetical protein
VSARRRWLQLLRGVVYLMRNAKQQRSEIRAMPINTFWALIHATNDLIGEEQR